MNALLDEFAGAPLKAWFDTGHHLVRVNRGWTRGVCPFRGDRVAGLHLNDVKDLSDDHLAPGEGNVDFAALETLAKSVRHVVFEPSASISEESLKNSVAFIRDRWRLSPCR
jgi:sugar phosphate isomerase/epimerase